MGFLTRFVFLSLPHIRHSLTANTQLRVLVSDPAVESLRSFWQATGACKNVHSFLMTQFQHLHTFGFDFSEGLGELKALTRFSYQTPTANPAKVSQSGCLGMEVPTIREHFEERLSYSLGLFLINMRVKIAGLPLDNGLLFAKHSDAQVKVQWCKQGRGACPCSKPDHLITGTCPLTGKTILLRSTIKFLGKSPPQTQGICPAATKR